MSFPQSRLVIHCLRWPCRRDIKRGSTRTPFSLSALHGLRQKFRMNWGQGESWRVLGAWPWDQTTLRPLLQSEPGLEGVDDEEREKFRDADEEEEEDGRDVVLRHELAHRVSGLLKVEQMQLQAGDSCQRGDVSHDCDRCETRQLSRRGSLEDKRSKQGQTSSIDAEGDRDGQRQMVRDSNCHVEPSDCQVVDGVPYETGKVLVAGLVLCFAQAVKNLGDRHGERAFAEPLDN